MALEKVLVVDDDPNICDVLMMYLENEGYSVILSYDGEEALVMPSSRTSFCWTSCCQVWTAGRFAGKSGKSPVCRLS